MGTQIVRGLLLALPTPSDVAAQSADRMAAAVRVAVESRGRASLALSGGNTPRDAYALLARRTGIDWSKVVVFWVDERAVPPTHDRSNYRAAKATLLDAASIPAENVHRMEAERADLDTAAREYEQLVRAHVEPDDTGVPAFDVTVMGIGDDGHTASLFPGDAALDVSDRLVVGVVARAEREARMTLTTPVLQAARDVFMIIVGSSKNAALERVWDVHGSVHQVPARLVRGCHGKVTWIVDRAAAGLLS